MLCRMELNSLFISCWHDTLAAAGLIRKLYLQYAYGSSVQLAVGDLEVYHVVLVDLPLQDMSTCADCIQQPLSGELPLQPLNEQRMGVGEKS